MSRSCQHNIGVRIKKSSLLTRKSVKFEPERREFIKEKKKVRKPENTHSFKKKELVQEKKNLFKKKRNSFKKKKNSLN